MALSAVRSRTAAAAFVILTALGLGRAVYDRREVDHWSSYERVAAKIDQVTPPGAPILANEPIYFLTRRMPPPGFELYYTHRLTLSPAERARLHILTNDEITEQARSGRFAYRLQLRRRRDRPMASEDGLSSERGASGL